MNKYNITNHILLESSWYENRKINVDDIIKLWLKEYEYSFLKAIEFIEEFGYLNIQFTKSNSFKCTIITNPKERIISPYALKNCSNHIKCNLLPIGFIYNDNNYILISEKGDIYQCIDDCICHSGKNFRQMIYNIHTKYDLLIWEDIKDIND